MVMIIAQIPENGVTNFWNGITGNMNKIMLVCATSKPWYYRESYSEYPICLDFIYLVQNVRYFYILFFPYHIYKCVCTSEMAFY